MPDLSNIIRFLQNYFAEISNLIPIISLIKLSDAPLKVIPNLVRSTVNCGAEAVTVPFSIFTLAGTSIPTLLSFSVRLPDTTCVVPSPA